MKENDGRAARRQLWRKILAIVCIFGLIWMMIAVVRSTSGSRLRYKQQQQQQQGSSVSSSMLRRVLSREHPSSVKSIDRKERQHSANLPILSDDDWDRILTARVHLIDVQKTSSHSVIIASFCRIDWNLHKQDPSKYPMYRFLVAASPDCESPIRVDFHLVVKKMKRYDQQQQQQQQQSVRILQTPFMVFHESRCGSTLVANLLASMSQRHRVYSESAPPIAALKTICGESYEYCDVQTAALLFQNVIYVMQRAEITDNNNDDQYAFFKIQSIGTRNLAVFRQAFPNMPFLFVYRDPVQVMVSHLAHGLRSANCVRSQHQKGGSVIPLSIQAVVQKYNPQQAVQIRNMPPQHFCAAHLASITEAFLEHCCNDTTNNDNNHQSIGIPIHYQSLPDVLYTQIVPQFHLKVDDWDRVHATAQTYSKSATAKHRGNESNHDTNHKHDNNKNNNEHTFQSDNERKEQAASDLIKQAAQIYLQPSYEKLLALSSRWESASTA